MKRPNFFKSLNTVLVAGFFVVAIAACDNNQNTTASNTADYKVTEDTEIEDNTVVTTGTDNWDYEKEYTYTDRDRFEQRLRSDIAKAERSLEQIDERITEAGKNVEADVRNEWDNTRLRIEKERQQLNQRLDEVENATENTWQRVRNDANTTLKEWDQEWEKLKNKKIDVDVDIQDKK